jgi:hypothetical protein
MGPSRRSAVVMAIVIALAGSYLAVSRAAASPREQPAAVDAAAAQSRAHAREINARIQGRFVMIGRITQAVDVKGEHKGQRLKRRWTFRALGCSGGSRCRRLRLHRQRSAGIVNTLNLKRDGVGRFAGTGTFYAGLRCAGQKYPRGELVPYRVTVRVLSAFRIGKVIYAYTIAATYRNRMRIDRTACPLGASHDAATYVGILTSLPARGKPYPVTL